MTTASPPAIDLVRVSKWYGDVLGVNEVTLRLEAGVTGLLGPNGAGKSTLIKLIAGMLRPSIGQIRLCGRNPFTRPSSMRRLGLCPEQDAFYRGVPALQVVAYLARLHGFGRAEAHERAKRTLERVGLGEAMTRSVGGYSKGMRQRFKLAQALVHEPDVLVLDEPMNGLDPPSRLEFARLIREQGAEGRCVVVSSHVLHELESVAERMVVMRFGQVLADGTPRELRDEMPEIPLTILIDTPDGAELASHLVRLDGVQRVEHVAKGLEVLTSQSDTLFDEVAALSARNAVRVTGLQPTDEDLEAVFRYLTEEA